MRLTGMVPGTAPSGHTPTHGHSSAISHNGGAPDSGRAGTQSQVPLSPLQGHDDGQARLSASSSQRERCWLPWGELSTAWGTRGSRGPRHSLSSPLTWHFSTAVLRSSWSLTSLSMRLHLCRRTRTSVVDSGISLTVKRSMSLKACVTVARYLSTESSAPKKFISWVEAKVGLLGANATD